MYPVSEAYKNAISQNERNVRIIGTITLKDSTVIEIDDEDIVQGSLYVSEQCVSGEDIEIGNVYASEMGLTLTSPPENPYALDGARIVLNFGINTEPDPEEEPIWEYVPLGYFYVTEIQRENTAVNLKALDGLILFDVDLSGVLTTGTPYSLIQSCCTKAGVVLATSSSAFENFANGLTAFTIPEDSKIETCRDLIMWVCQLTGTFARMNRMGQLEIVPVKGGTSVKTIDRQQRFTSDVSDSYVKITKVAMKVGDVEYSQGTDGMTMVLEENPLLAEKSEAEINAILSNILNQVTTAEYVPYNVNFAGDPALQAGDYVTLTGIKVFDKVSGIFTRSSVAYLSNGTQVAANVPRFEQGKFGKAVLVEEGTTNLWSKGNPETWEGYSISRNPSDHYSAQIVEFQGRTCLKVHIASAGDGTQGWRGCYILHKFTTVTGDTYTQQCEIYVEPGGRHQGTFNKPYLIGERTLSGVYINYDLNQVGTWQKLIRTSTANADGEGSLSIYLFAANAGTVYDADYTVYLYHPQIEKKSYPTTFVNGTRAAETLTIPTAGVLNPQEGTVECWLNPLVVRSWNNYFNMPGLSNGRFLLFFSIDGTARFDYGPNNTGPAAPAGTIVANNWYYIALRWSATTGKQALFVNGVKYEQNLPNGVATSFPATVSIVNNYSAYIDDLRISNRALTDEEIAAAYASGQPLPVDEYTTLKMNFDGSLSTITTVGDSIVTHSNWRYRGPHNIKAVGKSALVRGVQAQQTKSVSAVKTVAEAAREIAQAANQSTQLIQDAITGYVLIRKNETTGSNEILIMDNPDPAQARKVWRWNMGGLGYSDNVVGVDNPDRVYTVAMTMDGAINADFIRTGKLASSVVTIGPETTYEVAEEYTLDRYAEMTLQEIIDTYGGDE